MSYEVLLSKSAQKELGRLPDKIAKRILGALAILKTQPRPPGCKKLRGEKAWRMSGSAVLHRPEHARMLVLGE